ncbi:MAG: hypothetical protein PHP82_00790 [Candidatus ainarchaeum sp.]|nr:hypothetical protein [Candidatus ainarchaeum sp.]
MIKKIFGILLLFLVIGMMPSVFAETTLDANTVEEIKAFNTPYGGEVRILQLEKSITKNILIGAKIVEVVKENHPESDLQQAQTILNEMEALLEEVKNYSLEGKDNNTLAADFVAMKKQAIILTQEFKQNIEEFVDSKDRQQINEEIKELELNELNNINQAVRNSIRKHNAERTQSMFVIMGIENSELIQRVNDGNAQKQEIKEEVKTKYQTFGNEKKAEVFAQIRERAIKRIVAEKDLTETTKNKGNEKFLQIQSERAQRLNNWVENNTNTNNEYTDRIQRIQKSSNQKGNGGN